MRKTKADLDAEFRADVRDRLAGIQDTLNDRATQLAVIQTTLKEHSKILDQHIRRSEANEEAVVELRAFVSKMNGIWLAIGGGGTLVGAIYTLGKMAGKF